MYSNGLFLDGWMIAALILAIVGGILVVTLFLTKGNKDKFKGFVGWLYKFLNFEFLTLELIFRALYATVSIFIILSSFNYIKVSFVSFLSYLLIGLVVTRVIFELTMLLIKICNNVSEINRKLK